MGSIPQLSIIKGPILNSVLQDGSRLFKLFQKGAERYPNKKALVYEDAQGNLKQMTYSELDEKSNSLARALLNQISKKSANSDGDYIVAIAVAPSDALIISLLAIWKTGCCYLPLHCSSPPERVRHILAEAQPVMVITETEEKESLFKSVGHMTYQKLAEIAAGLPSTPIPDEDLVGSHQDDPIELITYTSGSTGLSKGVRIKNSSIKNRLEWQWKVLPYLAEEEYCVFKTALTFIDSVCEIWGPLLHSDRPRTLFIVPREITVNPEKLVALLEKYKICRLVLVPSLLRAILMYLNLSKENENILQNLKCWVCSGETLSVQLASQFFEHFNRKTHTLCNFYGSTEIMGDVTYHVMQCIDDVAIDNKVPIGVPIYNTALYLLDKDLRIVNIGEVGELYVSGKNVAAGYVLGRDAFRFVESPHAVDPEYKTLYSTGDYARFTKDMLIYEGRTDSQLKVRGHRVDLSEIETAVNKIEGIDKGVALCYNPGEITQQILAFVLLDDDAKLTSRDVEIELGRSLPNYALPQVMIVEKMPYLINGKVDRQYLLNYYKQKCIDCSLLIDEFDFTGVPKGKEAIAECLFKTIISVLGNSIRSKISLSSNFYNLGGNSLNSLYTISKLRESGYVISITEFILAKDLGEVLNRITHEDDPEITQTVDEEDKKYTAEYINEHLKEDVYRMIAESFSRKADIEANMDPPVQKHEYQPLLDGMWPAVVNNSIVARDMEGKLVGVSLVFDGDDEPQVEINSQLSYVLEFLDYLEVPIKETKLPKGKHLHSFMLGTSQDLTAQENIEVTTFLEKKILKVGKERGFAGILSTNTNPLTQQLAQVLNYKLLKSYQINQYVALNGTRPFRDLPDTTLAICAWKQF